MRRQYAQTVTLVDGFSNQPHRHSGPVSPAQTRSSALTRANEPERIEIEIAPETLLEPAAPSLPMEGGAQ